MTIVPYILPGISYRHKSLAQILTRYHTQFSNQCTNQSENMVSCVRIYSGFVNGSEHNTIHSHLEFSITESTYPSPQFLNLELNVRLMQSLGGFDERVYRQTQPIILVKFQFNFSFSGPCCGHLNIMECKHTLFLHPYINFIFPTFLQSANISNDCFINSPYTKCWLVLIL